MTDYKSIVGKSIKTLETNPDNSQAEGQIWFNEFTGEFKNIINLEAFSTSASQLTTRTQVAGSTAGTQTSNFIVGGELPPGSLSSGCEEYNGSGYNAGGDLGTARRKFKGAGTLTAGIVFGGAAPDNTGKTETYNGTSFSEVNDMNTARSQHAGVGSQTAALAAGGYDTARTADTEEYNGTSWSEQNNMSTARSQLESAAGTQTAMFVAGGNTTPGSTGYSANTEEYDGTSWTSGGSLSAGKNGAFGFGTLTAGVVTGGEVSGGGKSTTTEKYNGTSFSSSPATPATGRMSGTGSGSSTAGVIQAGSPGSATEEYNSSVNVTTAGAWATGGAMNTGRGTAGDCGTYLAGLVFGGNPIAAPYTDDKTEEYNGTSWSESGDLASATSDASGAGTQTAALCFARSSSPTSLTQTYDGSTWTSVPATLPSISQSRGIGTQTAALVCGNGTESYEYDGSSWTASGDLNNNRSGQKPGGWGLQTAAVLGGGYFSPPATILSNTETYNGTSWTETGHSVLSAVKRTAVSTAGPSSNGLMFSGPTAAGSNDSTAITQGYNGTAWFTQPSLATARTNASGFGTATNAVAAGGHAYPGTPGTLTTTEEFTGETTALNVKTLTTS